MNIRLTVLLSLVTLVAVLLAAAGCTGVTKTTPGTVKVGVLLPLTGDLANNGRDCADGITFAVEEINAGGGIISLGGARLEPVMADSRSNPADGANETERLIEKEGVVAVIGAYQSSVAKTASQAAERLETPFIVSPGVADVITERGFQYTFRVMPKAGYYGRDQVRFLTDLGNSTGYRVKRVALIHENTDFGTSAAFAQKAALARSGMIVSAEVSYRPANITSLDTEVDRLLASNPDAILETTYPADAILIRKALAARGSTVPLIDTAGGTVVPEYVRELGPLAEGTLTVSEYSPYAPGASEFNNRFRARFGTDITGDSAYTYQCVWVLKDALERAGTTDRAALRDAIADTDMPKGPHMILPSERIRFDADGQNTYASLFIVQIQNGTYIPVWPEAFKASDVRLPGTGAP